MEQLRSAKAEQRESERDRRFRETLVALKRLIPGPYSRNMYAAQAGGCKDGQKRSFGYETWVRG